jgi:hypothetical protein
MSNLLLGLTVLTHTNKKDKDKLRPHEHHHHHPHVAGSLFNNDDHDSFKNLQGVKEHSVVIANIGPRGVGKSLFCKIFEGYLDFFDRHGRPPPPTFQGVVLRHGATQPFNGLSRGVEYRIVNHRTKSIVLLDVPGFAVKQHGYETHEVALLSATAASVSNCIALHTPRTTTPFDLDATKTLVKLSTWSCGDGGNTGDVKRDVAFVAHDVNTAKTTRDFQQDIDTIDWATMGINEAYASGLKHPGRAVSGDADDFIGGLVALGDMWTKRVDQDYLADLSHTCANLVDMAMKHRGVPTHRMNKFFRNMYVFQRIRNQKLSLNLYTPASHQHLQHKLSEHYQRLCKHAIYKPPPPMPAPNKRADFPQIQRLRQFLFREAPPKFGGWWVVFTIGRLMFDLVTSAVLIAVLCYWQGAVEGKKIEETERTSSRVPEVANELFFPDEMHKIFTVRAVKRLVKTKGDFVKTVKFEEVAAAPRMDWKYFTTTFPHKAVAVGIARVFQVQSICTLLQLGQWPTYTLVALAAVGAAASRGE